MNAHNASRSFTRMLLGALLLACTLPASSQTTDCDFTYTLTYGCAEDGTGWATITNYKGPMEVEYRWDGSEAAGGGQIIGLSDGQHSISIFDGIGCETTEFFTIDCSSVPVNCQFRTQTQGGWGAPANGNNPGAYRNAHFAAAFPNGLTIGCTNKLRLTTAAAVDAFLPSGTSARALPQGTLVDPGQTYRNVLAGQLVSLTLSVGFDAADPDFGASNMALANASILNGPFQGYTVQMLLDEANQFIGGCGANHTAAQLNNALTMVNENYDNGTMDQGGLGCLGGKRLESGAEGGLRAYPNPASDQMVLTFKADAPGAAHVSFIDATGRIAKQFMLAGAEPGAWRTNSMDVQGMSDGTYLLRVEQGSTVQMQRVLILH